MRKSYCCIFAELDQSSTAGMGIIKLQSIKYSFFNILAIAIGALGILFIIPLDKESYGQINMLFTAAYLLTPFVGLGLPMVVIKYHGVFIRKQLDAYYLAFTLFFGMVITSVLALLIGIFYDELARFSVYFGINEAFILKHKFTILLLTILLVLNYVSISFSALHKRIAVPEVLSNVAYKVYIPLIILLIYHQYIPAGYWPFNVVFYGISSLFIFSTSAVLKSGNGSCLCPNFPGGSGWVWLHLCCRQAYKPWPMA
ncbi:MAG: hypothetical protein IPN29_00155 [Saprospiraceae bacterium]|nr:hypothetical protein [Saprospiraceae bacterium]